MLHQISFAFACKIVGVILEKIRFVLVFQNHYVLRSCSTIDTDMNGTLVSRVKSIQL